MNQTTRGWDWVDYGVRRIARIYLPYMVAVAVSAAIAVSSVNGLAMSGVSVALDGYNVDLLSWLRTLVFLNLGRDAISVVNIAIWSLRLEVALYVIAGLIAAGCCLGPTKRFGLFVTAGGLTLLCCYQLSFMTLAVCLFGCGAAAAIIPWTRPSTWWSGCVVAAALAAFVVRPVLTNDSGLSLAYQALLGIPIALWLKSLAVLTPQGSNWPRLVIASGAWSYTLYVTHSPILIVLRTWVADADPGTRDWPYRIAIYAAYIVAVNVVCWGLALLFERPSAFAAGLHACVRRVRVSWQGRPRRPGGATRSRSEERPYIL